jgi:thiol:disulfide interchange protein DsbD
VALGASLFRPGVWMEHVKSVFGIALLVMAAWFLRPISATLAGIVLDPQWGLWIGMGIAALGLVIGAVHLSFKADRTEQLRKGVAVAIATFGGIVALNNVLYVPPMAWQDVTTFAELEQAVKQAEDDGKPILIDFAAEWCLPCKEMELQTFHDDAVEPRLARDFALVKIDVTDPTDEQEAMKGAFAGGTLPAVIVYASDAKLSASLPAMRDGAPAPTPAEHFKTFVDAQEFLGAIENVD